MARSSYSALVIPPFIILARLSPGVKSEIFQRMSYGPLRFCGSPSWFSYHRHSISIFTAGFPRKISLREAVSRAYNDMVTYGFKLLSSSVKLPFAMYIYIVIERNSCLLASMYPRFFFNALLPLWRHISPVKNR